MENKKHIKIQHQSEHYFNENFLFSFVWLNVRIFITLKYVFQYEMNFAILNVSISFLVQAYTLNVNNGEYEWRVLKRYSQIYELYKKVFLLYQPHPIQLIYSTRLHLIFL
jgi:hypothetical protein